MLVLGLSGGLGHDSAACVVEDGQLLAYAEEERFVRVKHAYRHTPINSVLYCLNSVGIDLEDIDLIALSWIPDEMQHWGIIERFKGHQAIKGKKLPPIVPVGHHLSHAASSFYTSGLEEAIIIVMDGQGENVSTTVAHGKNGEIKIIKEYGVSQSIGYFYSVINYYLGLGKAGEGKLMGLASYGEPKYEFPIMLTSTGYEINIKEPEHLELHNQYDEVRKNWLIKLYRMFGREREPKIIFDPSMGEVQTYLEYNQFEKDIAASAQFTLENVISHLVKLAVAETGCRNLVLSGGVALNCTSNGKLERSGLIDELFVMPAVSDAGGCIGSAMELCKSSSIFNTSRLKTPYWGPSFSNDQVKDIFKKVGIKSTYYENISKETANLIAQNKVIGWFQGSGEMGPRALGNRSIIANPTSQASYERVNRQIKFREPWRPLAPSIMDDSSHWLLEHASYSPYMLKAYQVRDSVKEIVPAVVHVDGTTRPQTVRREVNPIWYDLISEFNNITGVPLLLNTSLNVKGEPICGSPLDALKTFYSSPLDNLVVGNFLISK